MQTHYILLQDESKQYSKSHLYTIYLVSYGFPYCFIARKQPVSKYLSQLVSKFTRVSYKNSTVYKAEMFFWDVKRGVPLS
jgi:hypothetical protein